MVMANVGENGGLSSTRISTSSSRKAIAATRSGWRAATVPPTVSATRPSDAWTDLTNGNGPWWAVVASGIYHGVNPGMGWPLAVSAALMDRAGQPLARRWGAGGRPSDRHGRRSCFRSPPHVLAGEWQREIQIGAACLVIALGIYLLINRRHPRFLARVPPTRLALWSFLRGDGAWGGLMLVPIYLGHLPDESRPDAGHAAADLMVGNAPHRPGVRWRTRLAMTLSGGASPGRLPWLGLRFLSRSWFNLDLVWAWGAEPDPGRQMAR
jgi:hypothetical protein